jgi:hypothetical protein
VPKPVHSSEDQQVRTVSRRGKARLTFAFYLASSPKAIEIASFDDQGGQPAGRLHLMLFAFSQEDCLTGRNRFVDATTRAADLS